MPKRGIKTIYRKPDGTFGSPNPYLPREQYGIYGKKTWLIRKLSPEKKPPRPPPPPPPPPEPRWIITISFYKTGEKQRSSRKFRITGARPKEGDIQALIDSLGPKTFIHQVESIELVGRG